MPERRRRRRMRMEQNAGQAPAVPGPRPAEPPPEIVTDPHDPRSVPNPGGGWSQTVACVADALIVPTAGSGMVQWGGVFDGSRAFVHQAVHWRRGRALLLPPDHVPETAATLPGSWVWGGLLLNHFGHFLTESTPRLWALPDLGDQVQGIAFLHKRNDEVTDFHRNFLRLLGSSLQIRVISEPTRVERLHVPGQGFGLGRIALGTERFRSFFRDAFARDIAADGPERLYVSRSALGPRRGGVMGETMLEERLAFHGYEVFHPQHHSLEVQIARYRAARQIVALDGSALHLAAFACSPDQRIAMIRRRSSSMSNAIALHIKSFSGTDPVTIDAILTDWVLRERNRADRFSMGELDMPRLQAALTGAGFIAPDAPWPALDPGWRDDQIARLKTEAGLDFVPVPRDRTDAA